jgi:hypothetical protein
MSSVESKREVVQKLAGTFNNPPKKRSILFLIL